MTSDNRKLPMGADLYGDLLLAEPEGPRGLRALLPGLTFVGIASLAALWLSEHYGAPAILMGLLIGFALNFASVDIRLSAGLNFASQTLLRVGIVLIGTQITFAQVGALGVTAFIALAVIMAAVIGTGMFAAKLLKQDLLFGLLAGGATAICGASAALALWGLIGEKRVDQSRFAIVLLGITMASAFAMSFYPPLAALLGLDDTQAGFLIGASVHDVAQAIGGGFSFSDDAGEVATIVKLTRVTLLAPVLIIVAIGMRSFGADTEGKAFSLRQGLPWFVVGFLLLVAFNTFFPIPAPVVESSGTVARTLLLFSVVAAAMKSNMSGLLEHGMRCFGPVVATTLVSFGLSLVAAIYFTGGM